MQHLEWQQVACFPTRALAELARGMLEARGLAVRLSSDDAGGQHPELDMTRGVGLQVIADRVDEATRLLADLEADADDLPWASSEIPDEVRQNL